jgi:uncharacterized protein YutE (UPF0331/DUF86 family)
VLLNDAPPGLAYRIFKDGTVLTVRDAAAFQSRLARAILEYLDFRPVEELFTRGVLRRPMVDKTLLASKIAAIREAAARISDVLPTEVVAFTADRTAREVVVLNLFVAIQECMSLATHWLADEGLDVPPTYGDVFRRLAERGVVTRELRTRLAAASGFRNLVAHQYGALDWKRVYDIAAGGLPDLLGFCDALATRARAGSSDV